MIIKRVGLLNFGIYKGKYKLDISPDKDHPLILIGGENGSGKTTLLTAVKIALYGPFAFGYKLANENYKSIIKDKINRYVVKINGDIDSYVQVELLMEHKSTISSFRISRSWLIENGTLQETLIIQQNGKKMNAKEISDYENYIRKFIPPSLFDFVLFDGEQINQLVENDSFANNVKAAFYTLFNLDIVETLKLDLRNYLNQDNIFSSLSTEEREYTLLATNIDVLNKNLSNQKTQLEISLSKLQNTESTISNLNNELSIHGGILTNQREQILQSITELDQQKKAALETLKESISTVLPFLICENLLNECQQQVAADRQLSATSDILYLTEVKITEAFEQLVEQEHVQITRKQTNYKSEFIKQLLTAISNNKEIATNSIHDLNNEEYHFFATNANSLRSFSKDQFLELFKEIAECNSQIAQHRNTLNNNEGNESFGKIINAINAHQAEAIELRYRISELEASIIEVQENINRSEADRVKAQKRLDQAQKDENIFAICSNIDKILTEFIECSVGSKVSYFEKEFIHIFNDLNHKDHFIAEVILDWNTFEITMLDQTGHQLPFPQLSAGEKQLYLLSLLWAVVKTSQRKIPLIFDTLLGRLDKSHKERILTKYIPNISDQVLILSTDSEVDTPYYNLISPLISQKYLLEFNPTDKTVSISNRFFHEGSE